MPSSDASLPTSPLFPDPSLCKWNACPQAQTRRSCLQDQASRYSTRQTFLQARQQQDQAQAYILLLFSNADRTPVLLLKDAILLYAARHAAQTHFLPQHGGLASYQASLLGE